MRDEKLTEYYHYIEFKEDIIVKVNSVLGKRRSKEGRKRENSKAKDLSFI